MNKESKKQWHHHQQQQWWLVVVQMIRIIVGFILLKHDIYYSMNKKYNIYAKCPIYGYFYHDFTIINLCINEEFIHHT